MSMDNQIKTKNPSLSAQDISAPALFDQFGRIFDYLRIAVNEKCNLRCIYCMPEKGVPFKPLNALLTTAEIIRLMVITARLGVNKVRFTGGEPLLRKDITELVYAAAGTPGIQSVHLTTNGLLLESMVPKLQEAGLTGVNISLDTLKPDRFKQITRREGLAQVMAGLDAALAAGLVSTKVNVVAMRNFNVDELSQFTELTRDRNIVVRFIELMPFDSHQIWKTGEFYGENQIIGDLQQAFPHLIADQGSRTEHIIYRVPGYRGKIAVIPAYSRHLCGACNRIRITADGKILNCLFSHEETNLIDRLRSGAGDNEIAELMKTAMRKKLENGWEAQKSGGEQRDSMTQIGG